MQAQEQESKIHACKSYIQNLIFPIMFRQSIKCENIAALDYVAETIRPCAGPVPKRAQKSVDDETFRLSSALPVPTS